MTFTYDPAVARTLDAVRLNIGDTDDLDAQLQDEEIAYLLTQDADILECSVAAADTLAARYARQVDFEVSQNLRMSLMQKQASYERLSDRLRRKIGRRGIRPYLGGASISESLTDAQDTDLIQPAFRRGMEEEPGTEPPFQDPHSGQPFPF